jgi:WhiB family redox-sensing transcriptional regulator
MRVTSLRWSRHTARDVRPVLVHEVSAPGERTWRDQALCAETDPDAFFPEKGGSTREAKHLCTACTVRPECLAFALAHDERFGVWGGLSERERRRLRR